MNINENVLNGCLILFLRVQFSQFDFPSNICISILYLQFVNREFQATPSNRMINCLLHAILNINPY